MSEKYPTHSPERQKVVPKQESSKPQEHSPDSSETLKLSHEKQKEALDTARHQVECESKSTEQIAQELSRRQELPRSEPEARITNEIKQIAYQRLLTRARHHLSPYSKAMSHVIHQPVVDTVSEAAAKTVGRPSGIVGGGTVALLGTTVYYYIAKHYGYHYNAFIFLALLAIGFILGWILELLYRLVRALAKH